MLPKKGRQQGEFKTRSGTLQTCRNLFSALERVAHENKGILQNPDRIFNLEKTAIDCTLGGLQRISTAAGRHNGGAPGARSSYEVSKHINAAITASTAGTLTPPFITVAGHRKCSYWWVPV